MKGKSTLEEESEHDDLGTDIWFEALHNFLGKSQGQGSFILSSKDMFTDNHE